MYNNIVNKNLWNTIKKRKTDIIFKNIIHKFYLSDKTDNLDIARKI